MELCQGRVDVGFEVEDNDNFNLQWCKMGNGLDLFQFLFFDDGGVREDRSTMNDTMTDGQQITE